MRSRALLAVFVLVVAACSGGDSAEPTTQATAAAATTSVAPTTSSAPEPTTTTTPAPQTTTTIPVPTTQPPFEAPVTFDLVVKDESTPALAPTERQWDSRFSYSPWVVFHDGQFHMFYTGWRVGVGVG